MNLISDLLETFPASKQALIASIATVSAASGTSAS